MSTPITACLIHAAARGNRQAFKNLVEAVDYNSRQVAHAQLPCECKPRCPTATEKQLKSLTTRVTKALVALRQKRAKNIKVPTFDKWIFPVIKNMPSSWPDLKTILTS